MNIIISVVDDLIDISDCSIAVTFTGATADVIQAVRRPEAEPILRDLLRDFGKRLGTNEGATIEEVERCSTRPAERLAERLRAAGLLP